VKRNVCSVGKMNQSHIFSFSAPYIGTFGMLSVALLVSISNLLMSTNA
jgi:hypothetical protein